MSGIGRILGTAALAWSLTAGPAAAAEQPFWWGVTLAGYQNDGGNADCDWFEGERRGTFPERSGLSADFRGHLDADLDRAASLGLNAFRTSIEWSRIEPVEGHYDAAEVAYVHRLLHGLRARHMAPVITLLHFAMPVWAEAPDRQGRVGWEKPELVEQFRRYAAFVADEFGDDIAAYLTINEPSSVLLGGYLMGYIPPFRTGPLAMNAATQNLAKAHEAAYDAIHARRPQAMVSIPDYNCKLPLFGGMDWTPGRWFIGLLPHDAQGKPRSLDFLAMHYYGTNTAFTAFPTEPWRWAGNPEHFEHLLAVYHQAFHLPILVAENGCATHEGEPRADHWTPESYLVANVTAIQHARAAGIPVIGYMYWTLTDNYEWGSYAARYGLWGVECRKGDATRTERPAAAVYREIIRQGGVTPALLKRYPSPNAPATSS